jgi:hypothetical protein
MIKEIDGYPVGFFKVPDIDELKKYYISKIDEKFNERIVDGIDPIECAISHAVDWRETIEDDPDFFNLYHKQTFPLFEEYLSYFNFNFNFQYVASSWYNVYEEGDHQAMHDHISTANSVFSSSFILSSPKDSGQLAFRNPNLSKHFKYYGLDDNDRFSNIVTPEMIDGTFIIFPSALEHYVMHNRSKQRRISMVSNYAINKG